MMAATSLPRLLVAGPIPPPYAGVETFTQTVINSPLLRQRYELHFCNMQKPITNEQRGRIGLVNIRYNLSHVAQVFDLCRRARPDLAYLPLSQNQTGFFRDSLLLLAARPFARRVVYQVHGGSFNHFYALQGPVFRAYMRWILRRADALLVGGERLIEQFGTLVPRDRFCVVPYGVSTGYPLRSRPADDDLHTIRVLFMGHISFAKGAVDLIRSLPLVLPRSRVRLRVQLAGEMIHTERNIVFIEERHNAPSIIQRTIEDNQLQEIVEFLGVITGEDKLQTLADADIFVLPSYTEAIGLSVMEAMAAGLPVIVTPAGALPDMLTEGTHCLFVRSGDPQDLADKMLKLIEDRDLRRRMGQANRQIIESQYNETAFLQRLVAAFDRVKGDSKASSGPVVNQP